jgi:hypothetical protein
MMFTCVLITYLRFTGSFIHSLFPSHLLRTLSTGFILSFWYMNTKYIHHIHPHSSTPYAFCPSVGTSPGKDLPFIFLECILIIQVDFTLVFQASCFNQINPPHTYSFSITILPYYSIAYSTLYHIHI